MLILNITHQVVLINGDLVVHDFPKRYLNAINQFLVYINVKNQSVYWHICADRFEAVQLASNICGHAVQIKSIERS